MVRPNSARRSVRRARGGVRKRVQGRVSALTSALGGSGSSSPHRRPKPRRKQRGKAMKATFVVAAVLSVGFGVAALSDYGTARNHFLNSAAVLSEANAPSPGGRDTALAEANAPSPGG